MMYTMEDYETAGCPLKKDMDNSISGLRFENLVAISHGDVCNGCSDLSLGNCKGMDAMTAKSRELKPAPKKVTNAQIADALGISKRQVSKMRKEGTLADIIDGVEFK